MPPVTTPKPFSIADALDILGSGKDTALARVRLQTAPQDEYLSALPPLWEQEDARYRKLWKVFFLALLPGIALYLASCILLILGRHEPDDQQHLRSWSSMLQIAAGIRAVS